MPRFYFHFTWSDDAVRDTEGVELEGFSAAYCALVQQVRARFSGAEENWWIEVSEGVGGKTTVILPAMVPKIWSAWRHQRLR
jgi:Domain of unknown function (DUF6894)